MNEKRITSAVDFLMNLSLIKEPGEKLQYLEKFLKQIHGEIYAKRDKTDDEKDSRVRLDWIDIIFRRYIL